MRGGLRLLAQLRNGQAFPQPTDTQAADHLDARIGGAVGRQQLAIDIGIHANPVRARARDATAQQLLQQRIAHALAAGFHAGGIDHALHLQVQPRAARTVGGEPDVVAIEGHGIDPAAMDLQLAAVAQRLQLRMHRGSDAVAVHIPVAHHVAQ